MLYGSLLWLKVLPSWKISLPGIKAVGFIYAGVFTVRGVRGYIIVNGN